MLNVNLLKLVVVSALAVTTTTMTMTTTTVYAQNQTMMNATMMNATMMNATMMNATVTNATTTTGANATNATIVTTLIWNPGEEPENIGGTLIGGEHVVQLSPQNIQYQQTDPAFAKLAQVTADCLNEYNAIRGGERNAPSQEGLWEGVFEEIEKDLRSQDLCTDIVRQGVAQFCESTDFATFDIQKCEEARTMTQRYLELAERFFG